MNDLTRGLILFEIAIILICWFTCCHFKTWAEKMRRFWSAIVTVHLIFAGVVAGISGLCFIVRGLVG